MMAGISHFRAAPDESKRAVRSMEWTEFRGWPALLMKQGPLELTVVPSIGGRLMSIRHGGVELAFINEALAGRAPDQSATQWQALCGEWSFPLWGGGKTWIAPESQWPDGAPQRDLDSGSYDVLGTWCDAGSMGVELQSAVCRQSGLQVVRRIELSALGTWTTLHRLINRSNDVKDCGIWDVLMLRRPGIVSIRLDAPGGDRSSWHEHIVPFADKGPIGDVRGSRFVRCADGVLSTVRRSRSLMRPRCRTSKSNRMDRRAGLSRAPHVNSGLRSRCRSASRSFEAQTPFLLRCAPARPGLRPGRFRSAGRVRFLQLRHVLQQRDRLLFHYAHQFRQPGGIEAVPPQHSQRLAAVDVKRGDRPVEA
jgi:hypothetical protein